MGAKIYQLAKEPYKFPDAVLVRAEIAVVARAPVLMSGDALLAAPAGQDPPACHARAQRQVALRLRPERKELAAKLPANILGDYDRILRARAGLALVPVAKPNFCGACRMTITPQRLQELRAQSSLLPCESCGRYLYWLP